MYLYVYTCSYQHWDVSMHRHASILWCIDARNAYINGWLTLSMLCGSILRIDVHEPWSETVVATFGGQIVCRRPVATSNESTLHGYYTYIRIFIHIHIHIHLHVHMSAQVSLLVMRIHRLTRWRPDYTKRVLNYIDYISVDAHHGEQGHEPQEENEEDSYASLRFKQRRFTTYCCYQHEASASVDNTSSWQNWLP